MKQSPEPPRRLLLIANPIAGGGRGGRTAAALAAHLRELGIDSEVHATRAGGDARDRAAQSHDEPFDGVVALGGDGTVNEVLNGLRDFSRPLGVVPVGTANVLALELRLPRRPDAAARVLASGTTHRFAVGSCDGRRFLLFVGAGVDGAIVERLAQVRTGTLGKHKWAGPILHTVRRWPNFRLSASFPDGETLTDLSSVLVTRVRNYGGVLQLVDGVAWREAALHVLCFRMRSRAAWALHGLRAACGRLVPGPHLEVRRTAAVRIDGEAPFQIDGDFGGRTPAAIELLPEPVRLYAPA